ncbi:hypothetical protein QOT17_020759 [Balamuthia mandrillaris]
MLLARDRENERSLVVQAQESVSAAEAAVANEDYVLAASKFAVASDLFLMSANAVLDEQSAISLRLLAETHKQRSEEILAYLKAERLQMFERSQKKKNKNERRRRQRAISLQESPCQRRPIRAAAVTSSSDLYSVLSESTPSASASASSSLDWPGLSVNDVLSSSCTSSSLSMYSSCEVEEAEGPFNEKTEGAKRPADVTDSFIIVKSETEEIAGEEGAMEGFEERDIQRGEEETALVDAKAELLAEKEEPEGTRIEQRTKQRSRSLSGRSNGTSSKQELASSDQHRNAFISRSMFVQPMVERFVSLLFVFLLFLLSLAVCLSINRSSTGLNQKEGLFKVRFFHMLFFSLGNTNKCCFRA